MIDLDAAQLSRVRFAMSPLWEVGLAALVLHREIRLHGFLVRNHMDERDTYEAFMAPLVADGTVPVEQTVVDGVDAAPDALIGVLSGANFGKHLVRLAD